MRDAEEVWSLIGDLCYSQHGGSGYSFTREDVLRMDWDEAQFHQEKLAERRKEEAKVLKAKK